MKTLDLILKLKDLNVRISLAGDDLKVAAPNGVLTPELKQEIKAHKAELLAYLHAQERKTPVTKLVPIEEQAYYNASYGQQSLWVVQEMADRMLAYNQQAGFLVEGIFDPEVFRHALLKVVQRHEILRTTFFLHDGALRQKVHPVGGDILQFEERSPDSTHTADSAIRNIFIEDIGRPFDLKEDLPLRIVLLRISDTKSFVLITMHHIISDVWSMEVLMKDLMKFYDDSSGDSRSQPHRLGIQYKDYSAWLNGNLGGDGAQTHQRFWAEQLKDHHYTSIIIPDQDNDGLEYDGGMVSWALSISQSKRVLDFCRVTGTGIFTFLNLVINILLHKYSGRNDILIGTPTAGRIHPDLENQIGYYVNMLPVRTDIRPEETFREFLERMSAELVSIFQHQDYPFYRIIQDIYQREGSVSTLFNVVIVLQNFSQHSTQAGKYRPRNLSIDTVQPEHKYSKYDQIFTFHVAGERIHLDIEFNSRRFTRERINRILAHISSIVDFALLTPDIRVSEMSLVSENELKILRTNVTKEHTPDACLTLVDSFQQTVKRFPDRIALLSKELALSYSELDACSNQLARHLRSLGVGVGDRVAFILERDEKVVSSILAILKAGASYVPIDPAYPLARKQFMITDACIKFVVVGNREMAHGLSEDIHVVDLEEKSEHIASQNRQGISVFPTPDLAYIIYTSGSTGQPKGVLIEHRHVLSLFNNTLPLFDFHENDRWALLHSTCFDFSVWEIFGPIFSGGVLSVLTLDTLRSMEQFGKHLREQKITVLNQVPSMFANVTSYFQRSNLKNGLSLRYVIFGGEALYPRSLLFWRELYADLVFINMYGITEITVHATIKKITDKEITANRSIVGKALPSSRLYIVDDHGQLVPDGVVGEIAVSGPGVARGYLNKPELTHNRIVDDPWVVGERMYLTGDRAVRWFDGDIEYKGRMDRQVKIRGHRIELGEVEDAIKQVDGVVEVHVLYIAEQEHDKFLAAYWRGAADLTADFIRQQVSTRLPVFALPGYFIRMDKFPLTSNGKLNRALLPPPGKQTVFEVVASAQPRTPTEIRVAHIWRKVLGLEEIGIHDNFFALGGHSLKAIQAATMMAEEFSHSSKKNVIFQFPTISELAKYLDDEIAEQVRTLPSPITPIEELDHYALSPAQKGLWLQHKRGQERSAYNIVYAFRLNGQLDHIALDKAYEGIIEKYEILRTVFVEVDRIPRQKVKAAHDCNRQIEFIDMAEEEEQFVVDYHIQRHRDHEFNLETGPLIRCSCMCIYSTRHVIIISLHHIITDAWSMEIFFQGIFQLYHVFKTERRSVIAVPDAQYRDFIYWNARQLNDGLLAQSEIYWRQKMKGVVTKIDLPIKRSVALQETVAHVVNEQLDSAVVQSLLHYCSKNGVSPFTGLLAALFALAHRYTGMNDMVIGVPFALRDHPALQKQLGFFVTTLPVRISFSDNSSYRDLVLSLKDEMAEVMAHKYFPVERIAEMATELRTGGLFNIVSSFIGATYSEDTLQSNGVTIEPLPVQPGPPKFDFTLSFVHQEKTVRLHAEFDAAQCDEKKSARFIQDYKALLAGCLENPDAVVDDLMMADGEEAKMSEGRINCSPDQSVIAMFEKRVAENPDAVLCQENDAAFTYAFINKKANSISGYLRHSFGLSLEERVVVMLPASAAYISTLLAILKCGSAYVPVSPNTPLGKLEHILRDVGPKAIVVDKLSQGLSSVVGVTPVVVLDDLLQSANDFPDNANSTVSGSDTLAYVVFTSGTTGIAKGVMITQKGLVNFCHWYAREHNLAAGVRTLLYANIGFDASILELWPFLASGATVIAIDPVERYDFERLPSILLRHSVNCIFLTPSFFDRIGEEGIPHGAQVMVGGEEFRTTLFGKTVVNLYGPAEATVAITSCLLQPGSKIPVPIGKPIYNTLVFVMNNYHQLQPVGVAGEICVAGPGVARGYLNDPELTAERFIQKPFSDDGELIYKTGDRGKWSEDGKLIYLGRADRQLKVDGVRIELSEIERVLTQHPLISKCLVVPADDTNKLTAYYTVKLPLEISEIKGYLSTRLPLSSIPVYYIKLDDFPFTPAGKINLDALLAISINASNGTVASELNFSTGTEILLLRHWKDLFGYQGTSAADHFFEVGGDSLKAHQLVTRVWKDLQLKIDIADIFKYPSIKQLAKFLDQLQSESYHLLISCEEQEYYSVSSGQLRVWLQEQAMPGSGNIIDQYFINEPLDIEKLKKAVSTAMLHHGTLRTTFFEKDGRIFQKVSNDYHADGNISYVDLTDAQEQQEAVSRIVEKEWKRDFDLQNGPVFRFVVLHLAKREYAIIFCVHHIVCDGWSMNVLMKDLLNAYWNSGQLLTKDNAIAKMDYKDFSSWHNRLLNGADGVTLRNYWINKLGGYSQTPKRFADFSDGVTAEVGRGKFLHEMLDGPSLSALKRSFKDYDVSLFMVLLTGLKSLLYRFTGVRDIVIGVPSAGRVFLELESQVGMYLNTLPLRDVIDKDDTFVDLLAKVKTTALEGFTHQLYPIDQIILNLQLPRQRNRSQLFDVGFTLQNQFAVTQKPENPGAGVSLESYTIQSDLWFQMREVQDGLELGVVYNPALFERDTVQLLLTQFHQILLIATESPDKRLGSYVLNRNESSVKIKKVSIDF